MLAGQALVPGQPINPDRSPRPTPAPSDAAASANPRPTPAAGLAAAPQLLPLEATLTREPTVTISGRLVEDLPRNAYRLRVYLNGELLRTRRLPRRQQFTLQVPLVEGANSIALAIRGEAGESLHSTPVQIVLDTTAPAISALEPANGATIYAGSATIRGRSEPGATLRVTSLSDGSSTTMVVPDEGAFEVAVDLVNGFNEIVLEARDRAGNSARAGLTLERREGAPTVRLHLSRTTLELARLPASMSLRADVRDAAGQPVDGAEVTFSLSPPGLPTLTYNATTVGGTARWASVRIADQASAGEGLATVLVTLPHGQTLTASEYFSIEE